ncbi:MAG: lamin tail domain-containing protein, partial [Verrucomicrobiales bacterium]
MLDSEALQFNVTDKLRLFLLSDRSFLDAVILQDHPRARRSDDFHGRYYVPDAPTPGIANTFSFQDQVVINEIMYHHRPDYEDPSVEGSTYRENPEEWLEIYNHSTEIVDLSGWRLRDGIRFEFPEGTTLAPDSYLVIADDPESFSEKYPNIAHLGGYSGTMGNSDERVELQDANGNPVDAVHYYDEAPWPSYADGGGSSLELINPYMDNARPEAWSPSDESLKSEWHTISYRATAERPVYGPGVRSFHELRLGYIQAGECLIDNVSVVADPDGEQDELVRNRTFGSLFAPITSGNWRLLGTHSLSEAIKDPDAGSVLKIKAESSMNYLNNIVEGALSGEVEIGQEYEVSFDVKWLGGSPQLRSEIYYNKFAKKHILPMPEKHGTPGAINSTFQAAVGPTFAQLRHDPPVPSASEAITVSVQAEDPDGIESITLYYSVDEEDWQTLPMTAQASGFEAIIPDQSSNDIIQFYVEGVDSAGATSVYPPDGPDSGAFVKVDSLADQSRRQAIRMITRASDASAIHVPIDILSNLRRDCTLILNEEDIVYNCGVRLRGSMFSRSGGGDSGVNLKLPADQRFRGMQPTIILRRRNPQEILVKHMANQAVGVPASYNDFVEVRG